MSVERNLIEEINSLEKDLYKYKMDMSTEVTKLYKFISNEITLEDVKASKRNLPERKEIQEKKKRIKRLEKQIQELKTKLAEEEGNEQTTTKIHSLRERLDQKINEKRGKLANQKKKIKNLNKKLKKQQEMNEGLLIIKHWNENPLGKEDQPILAKGKDFLNEARNHWNDAKEEFNKNHISSFIKYSFKALEKSVEANYIAFFREYPDIDLMSMIDSLFTKGLIVNTKHIDSLRNMVGRIDDGIEINPQANYINQIFDFFQRNFQILNVI